MKARTEADIHRIYDSIESIKRLSDRIIGIGPINIIGLDGILALIPIPLLSTVYSVVAGGTILIQGMRAHATPGSLLISLLILLVDSGLTTVEDIVKVIPGGALLNLIPGGIDALFQGHLYAAHIIQKDIARTHYVTGSEHAAKQSGEHESNLADMRAIKGKKRLVYLG